MTTRIIHAEEFSFPYLTKDKKNEIMSTIVILYVMDFLQDHKVSEGQTVLWCASWSLLCPQTWAVTGFWESSVASLCGLWNEN